MTAAEVSYNYFLEKARHYCDYQERTIEEVRQKLKGWSISDAQITKIINQLETEDLINEERFARGYALGKLRNNHWGRNKIMAGMYSKGLSELMIQIGLSEIDDEEYLDILRKVLEHKKINEKDPFKYRMKLAQYAYQKGFQNKLIWEVINEME
ncbi:MAG: RecX family transcriptional regulator [Bacteroidetes bacterium]|jgi:regulatory protein|nr:RecX family transcriptional regulator [Bacteroidota bacterium]MBU1580040.1 RecX family transcriptional regulator [Bacteroidota bacterium]MBU2465464.1 RecX family transcriptional regulator [Bacteroidota bacterium]MBU2557887.1 RecX family transcriptional regulator [Bacteroidota bacterium]MDA3944242.1 RecX family transcriptional regulator [Bacteroidota bacterium]